MFFQAFYPDPSNLHLSEIRHCKNLLAAEQTQREAGLVLEGGGCPAAPMLRPVPAGRVRG